MALATKIALVLLVLTAAFWDLRWRKIPNWLVLSGLIVGFALNGFLFEWQGVKLAALGLGIAFAVYFPLYLIRAMGAGDVKLMMAIGSLVGWAAWLFIFIFTGVIGGVIAIAVLLLRRRTKQTLWNVGFLLHRLMRFQAPYVANEELDVRSGKGMRLPHAASIAAGTLVFLLIAYLRGTN